MSCLLRCMSRSLSRLTPDYFRIGASSLLNDLLMQRSKQLTGAYAGPDYFTLD